MSNLPRGWRVKGSSDISHYYPDLRLRIASVAASCNQVSAFLEELSSENYCTQRCNLCLAKESSKRALAIIRKAWDTSD